MSLDSLEMRWANRDPQWFPAPGASLKIALAGSSDETFVFYVTRGRGPVSHIVRFHLQDENGNALARLETGGGHLNPVQGKVPDPLLEPFVGYRFTDQAHLHIVYPGFGDHWAVPLSATDFFTADPVRVMMTSFAAYCGILDDPPVAMELFDDYPLRLHRQDHFRPSLQFVPGYLDG